MKAVFSDLGRVRNSTRVRLELEPEADDPTESPAASLTRRRATFALPAAFGLERTHPDVLALAVLLSCQPWIGHRLQLDRAVSPRFAEIVASQFSITVEPVDDHLTPRERPDGPRPGLAYSGGVDSLAAAGLLPGSPVLYFLDRAIPTDRKDAINKASARASCEDMRGQGFQVREVTTDVEYLRQPTGAPVNLPTDLSFALPAVLCADLDGLDALTTGILASSVYNLSTGRFEEVGEDHPLRLWQRVTAAVGLGVQPVAAGLTEVSTALVVDEIWQGGVLSQSCNLGRPGQPCGACRNCFRKSLITSAHSGSWPDDGRVRRLVANFQSLGDLAAVPTSNECSIAFALGRYEGENPRLRALRETFCEPGGNPEWMVRHYTPSLRLLDDRYREPVRQRISLHIEAMDDKDLAACRSWDRRHRAVRRSGWQASQRLQFALTAHGPLVPSKPGVRADTRPYLPRGVAERREAASEAHLSTLRLDARPRPEPTLTLIVPVSTRSTWEKYLAAQERPAELIDYDELGDGSESLADRFATAEGDVLMLIRSNDAPSSGMLESHLRWHRSTDNAMVIADPSEGSVISLHRKLLVAATGYDDSLGEHADAELAYRANLAGAVLIDPEGRPSAPPWRRTESAEPFALTQRVPETTWRDTHRWRSWEVPLVDIVIEIESCHFDRLTECVTPLLGGAFRDVRLTLVGAWTPPWDLGRDPVLHRDAVREVFAADPRVRCTTWNAVRADPSVPWRLQASPEIPTSRSTIENLLVEAERGGAALVTVEDGGRPLARLERRAAFARAAWSGATPADLDERIAESAPVVRLAAAAAGSTAV